MARMDPVMSFNFVVTLIGSGSSLATGQTTVERSVLGGFSECSGLDMTLDIESYQEGGNNGLVRKFPSRVTWSNLHLKRGVGLSDTLWTWLHAFAEGRVERRDGTVTLQNEQRQPVKVWRFTRGLPAKWTGPTLNAGRSEVAIEELEIAHEGLTLVASRTIMTPAQFAQAVENFGSALGAAF